MAVVAGLVPGTVPVEPESTAKHAGHLRIALQAGGARAHGLVSDGLPGGFAAARQVARPAQGLELLVATGVRVQTVVVHLALDLEAGHVGVAPVCAPPPGRRRAPCRRMGPCRAGCCTSPCYRTRRPLCTQPGWGSASYSCRCRRSRSRQDRCRPWSGPVQSAGGQTGARVEGFTQQLAGVVQTGMLRGTVLINTSTH